MILKKQNQLKIRVSNKYIYKVSYSSLLYIIVEKAHFGMPSIWHCGLVEVEPATRRFIWRLPWGERIDRALLSSVRNIWSTLLERQGNARTMRTCSPLSLPLSSLEISSAVRILLHFSFSFGSVNFFSTNAERSSSF